MASSPSVAVLTLHNTPLSLKANYRHHVINSIWSLKALDNYVISDEEIIEDACFGGRFTPMCPSFWIDTYCSLKKVRYSGSVCVDIQYPPATVGKSARYQVLSSQWRG